MKKQKKQKKQKEESFVSRLERQVKNAEKAMESWPDWMRNSARWEGALAPDLSVPKKQKEEPIDHDHCQYCGHPVDTFNYENGKPVCLVCLIL